jgi:hypothetical protein
MGFMMDDDRFDELMRQTLHEIEPPPAPREEMWARIQAERASRRTAQPGVIPFRRRFFRPPVVWSAVLAATLVIGFGIGRISQLASPAPRVSPVATTQPDTDPAADDVPTPYRLAATQHLERTEALLASLSVDGGATVVGEMSSWARDLLTDTRLLLASPAAQDPALRKLLEDLELVLAQISAIPSARAQEEVDLIQDGINQSDVLLRLRAATMGRRPLGT